jgi:transposase
MANQIGVVRTYSSAKDEATSPALKNCPLCRVTAVPRGIITTKKRRPGAVHCPNCGHVYGRDI